MRTVRFTVSGKPFGKQRPRVVRSTGIAYTPKETVQYENLVKMAYREASEGFSFPEDAALDVRIKAFYCIPKSTSKKTKALMAEGIVRPCKKPDFDNIGKIVCDSLNNIAYKDDSCIVDAQVRKFYSETPRVEVTIRQIN